MGREMSQKKEKKKRNEKGITLDGLELREADLGGLVGLPLFKLLTNAGHDLEAGL